MSTRVLCALSLMAAVFGKASASVLYNAESLKLPHETPWTWTLGGSGGMVTPPSTSSYFVRLDTTSDSSIQQGWLQVAPMALNRNVGFEVAFDLRIGAETHMNANRAGVSVIVLGHDQRGIELSFWTNEVWVQNDSPLFTHGEGAVHDTTAAGTGLGGLQRYRLRVLGDSYALFAEGSPLLAGSLRDYSAFSGFPDPYETPNFLWVGDNAQSASASLDFSRFEVALVPEPGSSAMLALGLGVWARGRLRKRQRA